MSCIPLDELAALDDPKVASCESLVYFQPICSARTRSVFGVEALARGLDADGTLVSPAHLFAEAARQGVAGPCEMTCRENALAAFSKSLAGSGPLLFLNLNLAASDGEDDVARLLETARHWSVPPQSVVVEVLESRFDDTQRLAAILSRFREQGFLVALDDVGVGHSNLDRIPLIKPDLLKIDRDLVRDVDLDQYRQGVFKALVYLGRRIGALIVAEGVETEPQAMMALELGADLLQGYYVGRPQPPQRERLARAETIVQTLSSRFKQQMVAKARRQRHRHRQYNVLVETLLCDLMCSPSADFGAVLEQAVRRGPAIECAYILDETGIQVTGTVCQPDAALPRSRNMFRPAPPGADHSLKEYYYMLLDAELSKYTTDPYVSLATGNLCQTISVCFRDGFNTRLYVLCVDVKVT